MWGVLLTIAAVVNGLALCFIARKHPAPRPGDDEIELPARDEEGVRPGDFERRVEGKQNAAGGGVIPREEYQIEGLDLDCDARPNKQQEAIERLEVAVRRLEQANDKARRDEIII